VVEQMASMHDCYGCSILSVMEVPREETNKHGILETRPGPDGELRVTSIVEKPALQEAPSNLAVVSRYLLTPGIFGKLQQTQAGSGGEIQLTDAIAALFVEEPVIAYRFQGKRYDCGNKLGYLEATVELGLAHPELGDDFAHYLRRVVT
jgi:UTP--glucose-1-phosphate uridylyltransferase